MNGKIKRTLKPVTVFGGFVALAAAAVLVVGSVSPSSAFFHMAHLSPDAPAVDLYVNGVLQDAHMEYGQVGPLRSIGRSGEMTVSVVLAGTTPASGTILTANVNLAPGATYVIAVANRLVHLQIGAYRFNNIDYPANKGRVQVLHAMPNAPRLTVRDSTGVTLAYLLGYLEEPTYADLLPGQYILTGTLYDNPHGFSETYTVESGTIYTLIVAGPPIITIMVESRPGTELQRLAEPGSVSGCGTYTVQYGDTLSAIAGKYNTTVNAIAAANNISNINVIAVGQVLVIPCQ
jgi:hypothetical protein